jgi:hypothetical protein
MYRNMYHMMHHKMHRITLALILFALPGFLTVCSQQNVQRLVYDLSIDDIYTSAEPLGEETARPSFYTAEERLSAMELVADDGLAELWYCNRFMEIAVRDKSSGWIWLSSPYDLERDARSASDTRNNIQSLLRLVYFDRQQNERRMSSFSDVVMHRQFGYRAIRNGIEVQMVVGLRPQLLLVPPAAEADSFEELVINKIPNDRDRRRLLAYYTRYSWGDVMSEDTRKNLEEYYPGIMEHDLYVLRGVNEREMRLLEEMIAPTSYTWEDYNRDLEISGAYVELTSPPMFKITVSFTLDNGELVVNLPAHKIEYDDSAYVLGRIYLLEFFGAGRSENSGYVFVPDGSGALINFNTNAAKPVAQTILPVYGEDITFTSVWYRDNIRSAARFPVFGLREARHDGDRAWFAIIEEGEAMADIVVQSGQFFSGYETVSPTLHYRRELLVNMAGGDSGVGGSFRFTDRNYFQGDWIIRYIFLSGGDADYNGMAAAYRRHLISRGVIKPLENPNPAIHLDVLGLLQKPDTFMGIPYSRRIKLTTFEQASLILTDMYRDGIGQVVLRYRGWFNGGLDHTVTNRLSIERALGGRRGLESLTQTAEGFGYSTFFEIDFNFVRRRGLLSGYNRLLHGPQTIEGFPVYAQPYEMVSNAGIWVWNYYTVSPNQHERLFTNFARNAARTKIDGLNFSISSVGTNLLADYHRRRPVNLQESRDILVNSLTQFTNTRGQIIVDGGNAYTLPFAEHIMNIPVASSSHVNTDANIPFMQLVLHGYVNYSGPAINMFYDPELALLKNVEYGAAPAFMLAHDEIAELKDTSFAVFYSVDYDAWHSLMVSMYHRFAQVYRGLANIPMERHDRLEEGVYMTTFTNGVQVLVNYNLQASEVTLGGIPVTLAPRSWELRQP